MGMFSWCVKIDKVENDRAFFSWLKTLFSPGMEILFAFQLFKRMTKARIVLILFCLIITPFQPYRPEKGIF